MQIRNVRLVESLQKAGFNDKDARVYVALLEIGGGYPSRIADYAGLKRATVYNVLSALAVRGLVSELERRNKIFYQIDRPGKVVNFLRGRVRIAEEGVERAERLLPELNSLFSLLGDKPRVLFFEGREAVLSICDDVLSSGPGQQMCAFSNAEKFAGLMTTAELSKYVKGKEKMGITTRAVLPDTPGNRSYGQLSYQGTEKDIWPEVRFVSPERFPYEAEITIYGQNKVAITKFGGEQLIGVIIEDKIIHDMMRMVFELVWDNPVVKT